MATISSAAKFAFPADFHCALQFRVLAKELTRQMSEVRQLSTDVVQ